MEPVKPGTIKECREFIDKYSQVNGFNIYGNERYVHQYISEKYPEDEIKFDVSKIDLITIDIEVSARELDSPMSLIVLRRSFSLLFRITIPKKLLLGEHVYATNNKRIIDILIVIMKKV